MLAAYPESRLLRRALLPIVVLICAASLWCLADQEGSAPITYVPGKPWTQILPDPDTVDWANTNRPGYRFRGTSPIHDRFYEYIQRKRASGVQLSFADMATISLLKAKRRWPEAPVPHEGCRDFMRKLRDRDTMDTTFGENLMIATLISHGLWPRDPAPNPGIERLKAYLESGPFEARNWWERWFGRVEPLLDLEAARWGYDMRRSGTPGNVFPPDGAFNGMQITYNVSGASLGAPEDAGGFTTSRSLRGVIQPGTLHVSGSVSVGGYGATLNAHVWAGSEEQKLEVWIPNENGGRKSFDLSVPVPQGTATGGFSIRLDGSYSMGGGHRGLVVSCQLEKSDAEKAADQAAADAAWRAEVERTLQELGYEQTPAGKDLTQMRAALAGDDAAWKAYVDNTLKALGYDDSPEAQQFNELREAMRLGGEAWDKYVAEHSGPPGDTDGTVGQTTPGTQPGLPDVGGVQVGTSVVDGQVQGGAEHFPQAGQVGCLLNFQGVSQNTMAVAVWTRDGQEVVRSERQIGGNGWVSFSISTQDAGGLAPGTYVVTITAGEQVLGRKTFTIGGEG